MENANTTHRGWGTEASIIPAAENAYTILMELENIKWLDEMEAQLKRTAEVV